MKKMIIFILVFSLLACVVGCGTPTKPQSSSEYRTTQGTSTGQNTNPNAGQTSWQPGASVQLGPYRERVLLPNVSGQERVELLSVRSDGTVDYVFSQRSDGQLSSQSDTPLRDAGFQYYTITPEGTAVKQPDDWIDQLDTALTALGTGRDQLYLSLYGCEGRMYLYLNNNIISNAYSVLYLCENGSLSQIPLTIQGEAGGQTVEIEGNQYQLYFDADCFYAVSFLHVLGDGTLEPQTVYTCGDTGKLLGSALVSDGVCAFPMAASGSCLWWSNQSSSLLTVTDSTGFVLGSQLREPAAYVTWTVSPDGSRFYQLDWLNDSGVGRLMRYSKEEAVDLSEDFAKTPLLTPAGLPSALAVSNDGVVYAFSGGVLRQYVYNPAGSVEPDRVLRVWSLHDSQSVRTAVTLWNTTHSDVVCEYTVATENAALTEEELIIQLNTELVNGAGPDVLVLDGLPLDNLMQKGFLAPLDGLDVSDVYPNLLARFTQNGTLYGIPIRMIPWMLGAAEGQPTIRSLRDFADFVESYSMPLKIGYGPAISYEDSQYNEAHAAYMVDYADYLFDLWYPAWSDAIWEGDSFHSDVYAEFLTQTGRLVFYYDLQTIDSLIQIYGENAKTGLTRNGYTVIDNTNTYSGSEYPYALAANPYAGFPCFNDYSEAQQPRTYTMTPIPGPDGNGAAVPSSILALRAGCDAEAGRAFLQLTLSLDCQAALPYYGIHQAEGWAVTRAGTAENLRQFQNDEGSGNAEEPLNDVPKALESVRCVVLDETLYNAAKEAALRYYEGKLTISEAGAEVEREVSLYLAER